MDGGRVGEQEPTVGGRGGRRRWMVAGAIVLALLTPFVVSGLTNELWGEYPRAGTCKGYGYGGAILDDVGRPGHPTPEAALAAFAPEALALSRLPMPADGWVQYRGRWVRDMGDGSYYEVHLHEYPDGWVVDGDVSICSR